VKGSGGMKSQNALRAIFNSLGTPVLLIDRDYKIIEANRAATRHLDLFPKEVIGHSCHKVTHGVDKPCWHNKDVSCPVKAVFETGKQSHAIHQHHIHGKTIVEELIATPLDEGTEEINYVVEEFRDVTELLELKEGFLPICSSCKQIRDKSGGWHQIEAYFRDHTGADFSHTFCPDCFNRFCETELDDKK
jgi:PAS domain S-box-containing protein